MPDPTSSVSYRDISWADQPSDREDFRESLLREPRDGVYSVCREPPTVLGAVIWGDDIDVSTACRCAKPDTFDALVCDDRALKETQEAAEYIAQKAAELVLGSRMGRWR